MEDNIITPPEKPKRKLTPFVIIGVVLLALVVLFIAIATSNNKSQSDKDGTQTQPTGTAQVTITSSGFQPETITVPVNTTVEWVSNDESTTHVVALNEDSLSDKAANTIGEEDSNSQTETSNDDTPNFESGQLGNGAKYSFTFTTPGTYKYHDKLNPTLNGTIIVE